MPYKSKGSEVLSYMHYLAISTVNSFRKKYKYMGNLENATCLLYIDENTTKELIVDIIHCFFKLWVQIWNMSIIITISHYPVAF